MALYSPTRPVDLSHPRSQAWVALSGFLALSGSALFLGLSAADAAAIAWFDSLARPVKAPLWTLCLAAAALHACGGAAAWLVWADRDSLQEQKAGALGMFGLCLSLAAALPWAFFRGRDLGWSVVIAVALFLAVCYAGMLLARCRRAAGALWLPMVVGGAATALSTFAIWAMNP